MEAQLEEKNQELQRVSHACFSIFLFSSSPSFPFVRIYSAQRRTNFLNPVFDRAHSDWSRCLSLSLSLPLSSRFPVINSPPPPPFSQPLHWFLKIFPSRSSRLPCPSGEAEGEDEWRTQQAPLWHGGQAAVRVQREAAAPSEGEDGCPGRKGDRLRPQKEFPAKDFLNQKCINCSKYYLNPQINSWPRVPSLNSLPSRKWPV